MGGLDGEAQWLIVSVHQSCSMPPAACIPQVGALIELVRLISESRAADGDCAKQRLEGGWGGVEEGG